MARRGKPRLRKLELIRIIVEKFGLQRILILRLLVLRLLLWARFSFYLTILVVATVRYFFSSRNFQTSSWLVAHFWTA